MFDHQICFTVQSAMLKHFQGELMLRRVEVTKERHKMLNKLYIFSMRNNWKIDVTEEWRFSLGWTLSRFFNLTYSISYFQETLERTWHPTYKLHIDDSLCLPEQRNLQHHPVLEQYLIQTWAIIVIRKAVVPHSWLHVWL